MRIGNRDFDTKHHTYVMGILNVTPDSFSDGGKYLSIDDALFQTERMLKEGADIIDIGGESTRPGYQQISPHEEMVRILHIVDALRREFNTVISVDTYKSQVAEAAYWAGAHMVNDIWGFRYDKEMAKVVAKRDMPCCLMHNRKEPVYENLMNDVFTDLQTSIDIARNAGVKEENIILDPGIGFGKTHQMNLDVMKHLGEFQKLGYPVLLGTSRKSMIGQTLDLPVDQRLEGTLATTVYAVMNGCAFVRVHDVLANKRAIAMTEAMLQR